MRDKNSFISKVKSVASKRPGRAKKYGDELVSRSFHIPKRIFESLSQMAKERGISLNELVVMALASFDGDALIRLIEEMKKMREQLKKQMEVMREHRKELRKMLKQLSPHNIARKIWLDAEQERLIGEFAEKYLNWYIEACYKDPLPSDPTDYVHKILMPRLKEFLAKKGYVLEKEKDAESFLLKVLEEKVKEVM